MWSSRPSSSRPPAAAESRPLLVTSDPVLLDDLLRLCAAVGVEPEVASHAAAGARSWQRASIVLVGGDVLDALIAMQLRRRDGVVVTLAAEPAAETWRRAVELGAEHVVELPAAESWLVTRLGESVASPMGQGQLVAVLGARGGVGSSTLATVIGLRAVSAGTSTAIVDLDPWGGGLDLALALEDEPGARWPDLALTTGRLSASALAEALPRREGVALLSWGQAAGGSGVPIESVIAALEGLARAFELTVADVPRIHHDMATEALRRALLTVIVVPREIRAVAAAHHQVQRLLATGTQIGLVTRGPSPAGLDPEMISASLGVPLIGEFRTDTRLAAALERGELPGDRNPISRLADSIIASLPRGAAAA